MIARTNLRYFPLFALTLGLVVAGLAGCQSDNQNPNNSNPAQAQTPAATQAADESQDPAEQANLAPASAVSQQQTAPPPPPPTDQAQSGDYSYNAPETYGPEYGVAEQPVTYAPDPPPPLPEYDQPEAPGPDYIWNPGYWNYAANAGYYWVPGTWVLAPYVGALWTPGYWGFYNDRYLWHHGYWGPHIGFYGGVDYGHGYTGVGYVGGYWDNGSFRYNTATTRVNPDRIHNTYSHRVRVVNNPRVSYNGGRDGLNARPLTSERVASQERHMAPLPAQRTHREQARKNRSQWASQNHGRPGIMVAAQPLNSGRHAPAATPTEVRQQLQREHAGQQPAPRNESRPSQPRDNQSATRNQARPAAPARTENHPAPRTANHPETNPQNSHQVHPNARPEPQQQTNPQNHPAPRTANHPEANPQNSHQVHPNARPESQQQMKPQSHPDTRSETRPAAAQPQRKEESRPATHPQTRQQTRPETRSTQHTPQAPERHEQPKKNQEQNPQ